MPAETAIQTIVEQSLIEAVGSKDDKINEATGASDFLSWLVQTGDLVPPWWSRARDQRLSSIWKESNHLSAAVYNTQARIVGIPPRIVPADPTIPAHWVEAELMEFKLFTSSGFGRGWLVEYAKFVEALITQDNGAFLEVIGDGDPAGPIIGPVLSIRYLDSSRCYRTGHPIYPVIYMDRAGSKFKLHWTRVIYMSQMPSSYSEMFGVGFCAVSRAVEISQTLIDIIRYKQERLGSRPHNQILVGKGITAKQIMSALRLVEEDLSNKGFARYARTVALGSDNTDIDLKTVDLNHMEPFDEETSINLGMFAIAAAFGMDADELWPVGGKSAGKQEANAKRARSRGKLPTQITSEVSSQFNYKVLPPHLKLIFDFKDDDEDMQKANIKDIRARNRERDIGTGAISVRAARTRMMKEGDVDRSTFIKMELVDGRLQDGTSISVLFFTEDPVYERLLGFMDNPLEVTANIKDINLTTGESLTNDAKLDTILSNIQTQRQIVQAEQAKSRTARKREKIKQAFWALDWLEEQYNFAAGRALPEVPMQSRRQRTDIRVAPLEESPLPGDISPAQEGMPQDENLSSTGGG